MRQQTRPLKEPAEKVVQDIRRATRKHYSAEEKIRIVLEGLRGEDSIAELCRREGIAPNLYYRWSKDFLEAGKKRLAGDTARAATSDEVNDLRREAMALKEVVADNKMQLNQVRYTTTIEGCALLAQSPLPSNRPTRIEASVRHPQATLASLLGVDPSPSEPLAPAAALARAALMFVGSSLGSRGPRIEGLDSAK